MVGAKGVARLMMKARILAEVLIQLTESSTCMSENPEIQPFPTAVRGALLTMGQVISPWNKPFPPTVRGSLLTIGQVISGTLRVTTARLTYKNSIRAETRTEREGGSTAHCASILDWPETTETPVIPGSFHLPRMTICCRGTSWRTLFYLQPLWQLSFWAPGYLYTLSY
ncbi:uncharacterized protein LOC143662379 isoform X3 [Tamandua tetradactyla]|uniref:uncharacterized protein LOC143662379 isoform X3 n=1 Tax=Tamandua tetradactyla TaxID=48850 RepID=UPI004053D57C